MLFVTKTRASMLIALSALIALGCGGSEPYSLTDRVVESAISAGDPYDGGTFYEAFRVVALSSGEGIVNMEGQGCTNCEDDSGIDTQLYVKNLNGDEIAEDGDSGGGSDARVRFQVVAGEEFRVIATTGVADQTGRYRLTVSENMRIAERLNR